MRYKVYDNVKENYLENNILKGLIGLTCEGNLFRIRNDGTIDNLCMARYSVEILEDNKINTYLLGDKLILLKDYEVIMSRYENVECKFIFMKNDIFTIIDIEDGWYKLTSKRGIFMFQKEIIEEYFDKLSKEN
jgi:hypothetical protein